MAQLLAKTSTPLGTAWRNASSPVSVVLGKRCAAAARSRAVLLRAGTSSWSHGMPRLATGPAVPDTRTAAADKLVCRSATGDDLPVSADTLGDSAATVRNYAFASFWVQLPLTIVSACILIFALLYSKAPGQPGDVSRYFTMVGIAASFISTFFAHGFLTLARQAIWQGKQVSRSALLQNLVRNTNINLAGIGITLVGLQASVGTLVSKTMLSAANAPYAAPQPGGTLVSLDVFSLQASTNTLLAHFLSVVFANFIIGVLSKVKGRPAAA